MLIEEANKMFCRTLGHIWYEGAWSVYSYDFWNPGGRVYEWYTLEQEGSRCARCYEAVVVSESEPRYTGERVARGI